MFIIRFSYIDQFQKSLNFFWNFSNIRDDKPWLRCNHMKVEQTWCGNLWMHGLKNKWMSQWECWLFWLHKPNTPRMLSRETAVWACNLMSSEDWLQQINSFILSLQVLPRRQNLGFGKRKPLLPNKRINGGFSFDEKILQMGF